MRLSLLAFLLGFLMDMVIGDPHILYHPVRLTGHLITGAERLLRRLLPDSKRGQLAGGVFLVLIVTVLSAAVPALLLTAAGRMHTMLRFVLETVMCYQLLAAKSLKDESRKVYQQLEQRDLEKARYALSMIVGRDTENLDEEGITKAAVETIAENTSDGVIAPMLFLAVGGPVLGWFYKSVNTMDSMVGYRNETYLYFGRAAAKLDDILNYLPSRLSAWLMTAAAWFVGYDRAEAWRIYRRDRYHHASPNSAQTEAVMAGALGIQLAGDAWYGGKLYKKETIGDARRPVERMDIVRANKLLDGTAVLAVLLCTAVKLVILFGIWM